MNKTIKTLTLGCKVNQYETQWVREALARLGYDDPLPGQPAGLCVVNTCTVTAEADRKSKKLIRQLARENPEAKIVVMGCLATRRPDLIRSLPGVTEVITDKRDLPGWLARLGLQEIPTAITSFGTRSRAYVKIQDGCRMQCAYCIIPKTRPVLTSRPVAEVLDEIRGLVDGGYREMVLTGIHLGHYGVDLAKHDRPTLARLLRRAARLDGPFRLRISSIEAAEVTDELLDVMAEYPERICPHLHVSMQSGSDAVLQRMRRQWNSAEFLDRCQTVQERLDRPGLTTDVIIGFPGETEADFQLTCRAVEVVGFSKIHAFRFSARPGTLAAEMTDTISGDIQRRRAAELARIEQRLRAAYFESLVGRRLEVLVESTVADRPGRLLGTSARYVPVELTGPQDLVGQLVTVQAQTVAAGRIQGLPITD